MEACPVIRVQKMVYRESDYDANYEKLDTGKFALFHRSLDSINVISSIFLDVLMPVKSTGIRKNMFHKTTDHYEISQNCRFKFAR